MTPERVDRRARQLFEAGREEPIAPESIQRTQRAALDCLQAERQRPAAVSPIRVRRLRLALKVGAPLAAAAGVIFVVALGLRTSLHAPVALRPERLPSAPKTLPAQPPPQVPPAPSQSGPPAPSALAPAALGAKPRPRAGDLAQELELLQEARVALRDGDSASGLEALRRYDALGASQKLKAEARVLRMELLALSGRQEEAAALAQRFIAETPNHPLADRARAFLIEPATAPEPDSNDQLE